MVGCSVQDHDQLLLPVCSELGSKHLRQAMEVHLEDIVVCVDLGEGEPDVAQGRDGNDHVHLEAQPLLRPGPVVSTPLVPVAVEKVSFRDPRLVDVDDVPLLLVQPQQPQGVELPKNAASFTIP